MLVSMWREENTFAIVGGKANWCSMENSMEVPQKVKNRTTQQPSNCTSGYLSKGYKNADSKEYMHPNVYSSTINNS